MNIKRSYVYKTIRMAAIEKLFSLSMLRYCILFGIWVLAFGSLFHMEDEEAQNIFIPIFFLILFLGAYLVYESIALFWIIVALIAPEKSKAATRYADMIPFEEMCELVEQQLENPIVNLKSFEIKPLADLIVCHCYGNFAVIPYSVVKNIYLQQASRKHHSVWGLYVILQDTLSHQHIIAANVDHEEGEWIIQQLRIAIQVVHESGEYL